MLWSRAVLPLAALVIASPARAQRRQQPLNFSVAVGVGQPIGDFDRYAGTGFGVTVRTERSGSDMPWTLRGGLSLDRFTGKAGYGVSNYQYLTFATDLVHHTGDKLYQFAGVGLYQVRTTSSTNGASAGPPLSGGGQGRSESAFGFQAGVGYNFTTKGTVKTFAEVGIVDVLTSGSASVWFPVRVGVRL